MSEELIKGVNTSVLKQVFHEKGNVLHALKVSDKSFSEFGEAYFSSVNANDIKGWKQHKKMTMNLVVPVGSIKFYLRNENTHQSCQIIINQDNYCRLTVESGVWMAFEGLSNGLNMILNIASIEHDPDEAINVPLTRFPL